MKPYAPQCGRGIIAQFFVEHHAINSKKSDKFCKNRTKKRQKKVCITFMVKR